MAAALPAGSMGLDAATLAQTVHPGANCAASAAMDKADEVCKPLDQPRRFATKAARKFAPAAHFSNGREDRAGFIQALSVLGSRTPLKV
jgi:hypothetical protein